MEHFKVVASGRSSASSADSSSPALPELSIDASLQRLHLQEDFSASSLSSAALSRDWLRSNDASSECDTYTPSSSQVQKEQPSNAFRFPPIHPAHGRQRQPETSRIELEPEHVQEEAMPARPRTSRGLSYPKPFLSSSRTTSIASIAESHVESPRKESKLTGRHGTPLTETGGSTGRVETHRHEASGLFRLPPAASSWVVLFAPLEPSNSSHKLQDQARGSILLPLLSSFEEQVELLRSSLVEDRQRKNRTGQNDVELFLDLKAISARSEATFARITGATWPIMFDRFNREDTALDQHLLPHLYRETGLPIVASVRYTMPSRFYESEPSLLPDFKTYAAKNFSGFEARQSRDFMMEHAARTIASKVGKGSVATPTSRNDDDTLPPFPMLPASQSYPGAFCTPGRRDPLSSSSTNAAMQSDYRQDQVFPPPESNASITSQTCMDSSKLRSLSLAAIHPLTFDPSRQQAGHHSVGAHTPKKMSGSEDHAYLEASKGLSPSQGWSSQPSSRSRPSYTTASNTSPAKPTGLRSSRTYPRASAVQETFDDQDNSEDNLGSRFWMQLSSLGEKVSRERIETKDTRRRGDRNVSVSSTSSEASVFDWSPLGILIPTGAAIPGNAQNEEEEASMAQASMPMHRHEQATSSPVRIASNSAGRRRAHSIMVPLTGWRAGDSDLRTAEAQDDAALVNLPQVLLDEPQARGADGPGGQHYSEILTPTVATFQSRARALSLQPPNRAIINSTSRQEEASDGRGESIWNEAKPQHSGQGETIQSLALSNEERSMADTNAAVSGIAVPGQSSLQEFRRFGGNDRSTSCTEPTLSGLSHDSRVQQVDEASQGELGRIRATFETASASSRSQDDAGPSTAIPLSRSPSGSAVTESTGRRSALQVLHKSDLPPPAAALEPVWLTRSQSVGAPRISYLPSEDVSQRRNTTAEVASSSTISEWAELAQRLDSPGSMRLLCLAASSWSSEDLVASSQLKGTGGAGGDKGLSSGLIIPSSPSKGPLVRSQSLSAIPRGLDSTQHEVRVLRDEHLALSVDQEPGMLRRPGKRLVRKKAVLLGPIRIPGTVDVQDTKSVQADAAKVGRMKRSMSNIFDPPSPMTASAPRN